MTRGITMAMANEARAAYDRLVAVLGALGCDDVWVFCEGSQAGGRQHTLDRMTPGTRRGVEGRLYLGVTYREARDTMGTAATLLERVLASRKNSADGVDVPASTE